MYQVKASGEKCCCSGMIGDVYRDLIEDEIAATRGISKLELRAEQWAQYMDQCLEQDSPEPHHSLA